MLGVFYFVSNFRFARDLFVLLCLVFYFMYTKNYCAIYNRELKVLNMLLCYFFN